MGYLDALAASTFRTDSSGRLVIVPFGRRGKAYLVPPERARSFAQFQRWFYGLVLIGIVTGTIAFSPLVTFAVVLPFSLAVYSAYLWRFTRRLETAPEVPDLSRKEAVDRNMRAMGTRTIATVCLAAGLMAALSIFLLFAKGFSILSLASSAYFGLVAVLYAIKWKQFRRRDAAT
jgi:hypothetical protein